MKKFLLLSGFIAMTVFAYGQCTVQTDFGDEPFAVAPDTIVNFVGGTINSFYSQQMDVKVPENGGFVGAPFVTVDSAQVIAISGLPAGLEIICAGNAVSNCTYLGGTEGCALISGIPTESGTFELVISVQIYSVALNAPFDFDGYRIVIEGDPSGLEDNDNLAFKMEPAHPNPSATLATIVIDAKDTGIGQFRVFDLVGKEVFTKDVMLKQGSNKIDYVTADMPEGVYIYRLDAFGESMTSRLVVLH